MASSHANFDRNLIFFIPLFLLFFLFLPFSMCSDYSLLSHDNVLLYFIKEQKNTTLLKYNQKVSLFCKNYQLLSCLSIGYNFLLNVFLTA